MSTTLLLLLVEDEVTVRIVLNEALEDAGYEVVLAENGRDALHILDRKGETLRGLITDVNLGNGPDGWDIARHARELDHDIPVVYMSGASAHDWASHGVPNSSIVAKPFALAQIIAAISNAINASDAHSS